MKRVFFITFLVVLLDQLIKLYIKSSMYLGQEGLDLGILHIIFVENKGMAFGTVLPGSWGKISLSVLRLILIFVIYFYIKKSWKKGVSKGFLIAASLVWAGAIGNLLDSAFYGILFGESGYGMGGVAEFMPPEGGYAPFLMGSVVDMFQFTLHFPNWVPWVGGNEIFPFIFNLADASISVGIIIIILWQRTFFKESLQPTTATASPQKEEE